MRMKKYLLFAVCLLLSSQTWAQDQISDANGETEALTYDNEGYAMISTAKQLYSFFVGSNKRDENPNVRLMADIDFTEYNYTLSDLYHEFDGGGHTIKVNLSRNHSDVGLFEYLKGGSYVHDLHVDGVVRATKNDSKWTALFCGDDQGATVENILVTGDVYTAYTDGSNSWTGLVFGYAKNNPTYKNIVAVGTIHAATATGCGVLIGEENTPDLPILNYLSCVDFDCEDLTGNHNPLTGGFRSGAKVTVTNGYYADKAGTDYGDFYDGFTKTTLEEVKTGFFTKLMTEGDENTPWVQNEGDDYPTMQSLLRVKIGESSYCIKQSNLTDVLPAFKEYLEPYLTKVVAKQAMIDELSKMLETLCASTTMDELSAIYPVLVNQYQQVEVNAAAYVAFKKTAEDAQVTLGDAQGSIAQELRDYLTDFIEPSTDFPYGSVQYVLENMSCGNEDLQAQVDWIAEMLKKVSATNAEAGTDITAVLDNPKFTDQSNGWSGKPFSGYIAEPAAAEYKNKAEGRIYQKITGLKAGIYELDMNALTRINDDPTNSGFIGVIFANDIEAPIMNVSDDKLAFENAQDGVNCNIANADTYPYDQTIDDTYYVPQSLEGAAIAMNSGRYLNRVLVNVTDGALKVGTRLYGSKNQNDWLAVANTRLIYQGTFAEAGAAIQNTLDGMVARATSFVNFQASPASPDYLYLPNFSAATRQALQSAIDKAGATTDAEAQYELIQQFSALFKQVYAERMAYRTLANDLEDFMGSKVADEAVYNAGWEKWVAGSLSADEAIELGKTMLRASDVNVDTPVADLLDVQFNADGSATDVSKMANEIVSVGIPAVKKSAMLDMNVFCGSTNLWGIWPTDYYSFTMTDELWSRICDGVSMEIYVRPYVHNSSWVGVLSYEEGGGIGMITDAGKWCIEGHIGGGYKEAYGSAPVDNEWIHMVGVWNKEEGKLYLYVNGNLVATTDAAGDLKAPGTSVYNMIIGGDLNGGATGDGQSAFQGDIAIARIYDNPLNADQCRKLWQVIRDKDTGKNEHEEGYTEEDDEDGIQIVKAGQNSSAPIQGIYNLMGQKLVKVQRGINIINGKKVFVK